MHILNNKDIFSNRIISSFPLSIGTGLALESVFEPTIERYDDTREHDKVIINDYKYHIFSIYTLARNIVAATGIKDKMSVITNKLFFKTLKEEIEILISLYSNTECIPVIYFPDYSEISKKYNRNKDFKTTSVYEELIIIFNAVKPNIKSLKEIITVITEKDINVSNEKMLITTSMASDLIMYKKIKHLYLLESHTGNLVGKENWWKKYHNIGKRPMDVFPFIEELLYVLGDNTVVRPVSTSFRIQLHEFALANKWTHLTTRDKVMFDIKKDNEIGVVLNSFHTYFR